MTEPDGWCPKCGRARDGTRYCSSCGQDLALVDSLIGQPAIVSRRWSAPEVALGVFALLLAASVAGLGLLFVTDNLSVLGIGEDPPLAVASSSETSLSPGGATSTDWQDFVLHIRQALREKELIDIDLTVVLDAMKDSSDPITTAGALSDFLDRWEANKTEWSAGELSWLGAHPPVPCFAETHALWREYVSAYRDARPLDSEEMGNVVLLIGRVSDALLVAPC